MAMANELLLGIDLGTAGVKLLLGGADGQVVHRAWLPCKSNPLASLLETSQQSGRTSSPKPYQSE